MIYICHKYTYKIVAKKKIMLKKALKPRTSEPFE